MRWKVAKSRDTGQTSHSSKTIKRKLVTAEEDKQLKQKKMKKANTTTDTIVNRSFGTVVNNSTVLFKPKVLPGSTSTCVHIRRLSREVFAI